MNDKSHTLVEKLDNDDNEIIQVRLSPLWQDVYFTKAYPNLTPSLGFTSAEILSLIESTQLEVQQAMSFRMKEFKKFFTGFEFGQVVEEIIKMK